MPRRFIFRILVTLTAGLIALALDVLDGYELGFSNVSNGIYNLLMTMCLFLGWAGISEISELGHKRQAELLGIFLVFAGLSKWMTASPAPWTSLAILAVTFYSLAGAWWLLRKK